MAEPCALCNFPVDYGWLLDFCKNFHVKILKFDTLLFHLKIKRCEFLGIFSAFPMQNAGLQGVSWKRSIFTIGFPIVMKISPEIHIARFSNEIGRYQIWRFGHDSFLKSLVLIHSPRENYTEHLFRPTNIRINSSTFFVLNYFR